MRFLSLLFHLLKVIFLCKSYVIILIEGELIENGEIAHIQKFTTYSFNFPRQLPENVSKAVVHAMKKNETTI